MGDAFSVPFILSWSKVILSYVKQQCGPLPPGLNLIEIELFIKMLYGFGSSLQGPY